MNTALLIFVSTLGILTAAVACAVLFVMAKERDWDFRGLMIVMLCAIASLLSGSIALGLLEDGSQADALEAACPEYSCTYDELKDAAFDLGIAKDSSLFERYELGVLKRSQGISG